VSYREASWMFSNAQRELKFYKPLRDDLFLEIENVLKDGGKNILFLGKSDFVDPIKTELLSKYKGINFEFIESGSLLKGKEKIPCQDSIVILEKCKKEVLADFLLNCVDLEKGVVIAPEGSEYYKNLPIFIMTIPKSGTHMLIGLLEKFGYVRNKKPGVLPGMWCTIDSYNYHAPCREFMSREWADEIGKHPFFRSPAIFMYRNPLDIVVSEYIWFQKGIYSFSRYFMSFESDEERLTALIEDNHIMGSIRDRVNRYIGWMDFANVIPVSYEELVGQGGGGVLEEQVRTIWSFQLKLQVPGSPQKFAGEIYNPKSATFDKGVVGRHKEYFRDIHYEKYYSLSQDFIKRLGYENTEEILPEFVERCRRKKLEIWRPSSEELWGQRLVEESYFGYNIIAVAGEYAVVSVANGSIDFSDEDGRNGEGVYFGFQTVQDSKLFIGALLLGGADDVLMKWEAPILLGSFKGFSLLGTRHLFFGVRDGLFIDFQALTKKDLDILINDLNVFQGRSREEVEASIKAYLDARVKKGEIIEGYWNKPKPLGSYMGFSLMSIGDDIVGARRGRHFDFATMSKWDLEKSIKDLDIFRGGLREEVEASIKAYLDARVKKGEIIEGYWNEPKPHIPSKKGFFGYLKFKVRHLMD